MSWNDRQQKAIDLRGRSVVVSAAAGSGKTSVLTERVLRLIEEGADLERMLIVTFTNLAAGEMKERIFRRLQEAGGARLAAQAEKCAFADISTIHAFCGRVIRDNFIEAGVSPSFSVADEASISAMKERAMDEAVTSAAQNKALYGFVSRFSPRGDMQSIKDTAFAMYDRVISLKNPLSWLDSAASNFDSVAFIETLFDEYKNIVREAVVEAHAHLLLRTAAWRERGFNSEAEESEKQRLNIVRAAQQLDIKNVFIPQAVHISSKEKGAPNWESKTHTNRANKCLSGLDVYMGDFAAKIMAELSAVREDALALISITGDFMRGYAAQKRRKNVLDHDDLIHFALKALSVPDIAKRYQEKYSHVFVDEYQDINDAQNAILKSVQRGDNDFIVGDVKQCIYMFRESNPELLTARCAELKETGLIEMNSNYRSEPKVIEFINGIMSCMMDERAGGVKYAGGQALECSVCGEGLGEIVLAGKGDNDSITAEGAAIASIIKELVAQGFAYKDIAILRPEVSSSGRFIAKALGDAGIPVISGTGETDAKFSELGVFLNLVSLIESPGSDIALLSVMRYPHFGFTEPEFAQIRLTQQLVEDKSFYYAVCSYGIKDELGEKLGRFFSEIEHYRLLSQSLKLPDFLTRLRHEAEFEEYALTSPAGKSADNAITSFINAVAVMNEVRLADIPDIAKRIGAAKQQLKPGETDAVYLTTIHKSKGLEFPAVILSGMHKVIDQRDSRGTVLVGRSLGLALDIINENTRVRTRTLHRQAVERRMRAEVISETVRLLYVGMTRAGRRLIITGMGDEIKDKWLEEKSPSWQFGTVTYFDLIMPAAVMMCAKDGKDLGDILRIINPVTAAEEKKADRNQRLNALFEEAENTAEKDLFEDYAFNSDLGVPSKVSVSAIKRLSELQPEVIIKPQYIPDESSLTAAEKGTLMHKALQKTKLAKKSVEEAEQFLKSLVSDGILDSAAEEVLDARCIAEFLSSEIAQRARDSSRKMLEAPFCLSLSAKELGLADSEESVIVQGVIDLCFLEQGEWVIVDYKTDRVSGDYHTAAEKYRTQLSLYARALEAITCIRVKEKYIYFVSSGVHVLLP